MNILVFDLETIPDTESGARICGLDGLAEADIARAMVARQVQKSGNEFLPLHLHAWQDGRRRAIRDYCEVDVINTLLVYLRWEVVRGNLDAAQFERECARVAAWLRQSGRQHFVDFVDAWEQGGDGDVGDGDNGTGDP